jgi:hypothetical protein
MQRPLPTLPGKRPEFIVKHANQDELFSEEVYNALPRQKVISHGDSTRLNDKSCGSSKYHTKCCEDGFHLLR